jgi:hypothetical protein
MEIDMKKLFALKVLQLDDGKDQERIKIAKDVCRAFEMKKKNDFLWEHKSEDLVIQAQGQCADFGLPLSETKIWSREDC